jgi:hypothetical protein
MKQRLTLILALAVALAPQFGLAGSGSKGAAPSGPNTADQVMTSIFTPASNVIRIENSSGSTPPPIFSPNTADEVLTSIFDASSNAIHVQCVSGCSGGGGGAATSVQFGANPVISLGTTQPSSGQCLLYNGTNIVGGTCGSGGGGITGWTQNGTTGTVLAQPASGQDAVTLQLEPTVASPASDIFQVYLPGATPSTACATNTKCAFGIQANGNMYLLGNSLTLGSANQATASNVALFGGTPGQGYLKLSSAALSPPAAPTAVPASGGSLPASTAYDVETTYVNPAGETTASTVTVTAATSSTCTASGNCSIQVTSPPAETNATGYNVYVKATGGSNYFLQNASPTAIGTNFTMTSENTSSANPPTANTTGAAYNSFLSMSAEGSGVLCSSSSAPGGDCASGTRLVMQAAGTPTTGDCVQWTGPNQVGDQGSACGGGGGSSSWSALTAPTGNLSLSMAGDSSTFTWTGGNEIQWGTAGNVLWQNTTAATSGTNQNSPTLTLGGTVWNGSASVADTWTLQDQIASGSNGQSVLEITHTGSSANNSSVSTNMGLESNTASSFNGANLWLQQAAGSSNDFLDTYRNGTYYFTVNSAGSASAYGLRMVETSAPSGSGGIDSIWGDTSHVLRVKLNNGPSLDLATHGVNNIAYSTTPSLDMSKGNVQQFSCTTAGAAISPTTANLRAGQIVTFVFIQNGTTACTVTFPSNMHGATTVGTTLSGINTQQFVVTNNGSDLYAVGSGTQNMTGGTP